MFYTDMDWKYLFPCGGKLDARMLATFDPWIRGLARLSEKGVRKALRARWSRAPRYLAPLRDKLLTYTRSPLVGCGSSPYVQLAFGKGPGADVEWPWLLKEWRTTAGFDRAGAVKYLLREKALTQKQSKTLSDEDLEDECRRHWGYGRAPVGGTTAVDAKGDSRPSFYLPEPATEDVIRARLDLHGLTRRKELAAFFAHFDGLHETVPSHAGGFARVAHLRSLKEMADLRPRLRESPEFSKWKGAVELFRAVSGDSLLFHQDGSLAWLETSERTIEPKWQDLASFVKVYGAAQPSEVPFDSYYEPG
jgi:hypothetical protein